MPHWKLHRLLNSSDSSVSSAQLELEKRKDIMSAESPLTHQFQKYEQLTNGTTWHFSIEAPWTPLKHCLAPRMAPLFVSSCEDIPHDIYLSGRRSITINITVILAMTYYCVHQKKQQIHRTLPHAQVLTRMRFEFKKGLNSGQLG